MENKHPTLNDPTKRDLYGTGEMLTNWELVKQMYFNDSATRDQLDPIERLDRMESRQRNKNKNAR